jgi:DNA-binding NtrC family response regulator
MSTILLIGADDALLEGLSQALMNAGHDSRRAHTAAQGVEFALTERPLVVVVERATAMLEPDALRVPLASGGAVLLCHREGDAPSALPPALQRLVLADLTLPLERNRLLALVHRVADRARVTGRETGRPPAAPDGPRAP